MNIAEMASQGILAILGFTILYKLIISIQMVPTQTALIVERLGNYHMTLQPGFHILVPWFDKVAFKLDLREQTNVVEPQECFTRDNVLVEVDGVIYISVVDAEKASYGITDYRSAAIQLAQTTTRAIIGTIELDKTFEERELISARVVEVLSEVAEAWGIRVHRYEVKNIVPPESVKNAMEKQMTAERDKRAILARAEGVRQANINESEGVKNEMINLSEGIRQKSINEAQGRAREILSIAEATASSINKVALAITESNGEEAINMRLAQQYLDKFSLLADDQTNVVIPLNVNSFEEVLQGIKKSTSI